MRTSSQFVFIIILGLSAHIQCQTETPIDGNWNTWMAWTTCSVTCGNGYHVRSRICNNPAPADNGGNCTGADHETKPCEDMINCPIDGAWSDWAAWRGCTTTCGIGVTFRTRMCDGPKPAYNGSDCMGSPQEFSKCDSKPCPVDGGWTNWGAWGGCSASCGPNINRPRLRYCSNPVPINGGANCTGDDIEQGTCDFVDCVDGIWGTWAAWGDCSATCGTSIHFRFRDCAISANNGSCEGGDFESGICTSVCPVDGDWSDWQEWSSCSASCENGTSIRMRDCSNPAPVHGGQNCTGSDSDMENCTNPTPCPVDGGWSDWASWTDCDKTCGEGHQIRIRRCSNPPPLYNGQPCPGRDIETNTCTNALCPVDGGWSTWYSWSSCSATCGAGSSNRFRMCSNPKPAFGGQFCDGEFDETKNCTAASQNVGNCTVDGEWGSWGSWSQCEGTCGTGTAARTRLCNNPAPSEGGDTCAGSDRENTTCAIDTPCPVNGGWASWRDWFPCSVTCGDGTQIRIRTCSSPKPQYGGEYCLGDTEQTQNCTSGPACTVDTSPDKVVIG